MVAGWYWYQAGAVTYYPDWTTEKPKPVDQNLAQIILNSAMMDGMAKAARLNKTAALWTALSLALGAAANI
jgi:hypothetical protein